MLTIFTPTYNRVDTLKRLYDSLLLQTCKDFIWLIVDDGSNDNTYERVCEWINEDKVKIKYVFQNNQGKASAHNTGVCMCTTPLFTCVDSDDFISERAVSEILNCWPKLQVEGIIGILALRGYVNGNVLTRFSKKIFEHQCTTLKDAYDYLGLTGDTMLIYKTELLKKHMFPCVAGEKFFPEAYIYDQLDDEGRLLILSQTLYFCEYLEDGYTQNMTRVLLSSPQSYLIFIKQRMVIDSTLKHKCFDTIRYTAFCIATAQKKYIRNSPAPILTALLFPAGLYFYFIRYRY